MKAVFAPRYGTPEEAIEVRKVEKPDVEEGKVLVKIFASSMNPADYHTIAGGSMRVFTGLRKPKDPRFGSDIAGRVEAVGEKVTRFKPGDEVYGVCPGGFAEYGSAKETRLSLKPSKASFEQAAAVPIAAVTALQGLRDRGKIHAGQKVLVNGASGGVGSFAVQIAKSYDTEVTGVTSTRNLELVQKIGADHVIDYTKEDFTRNGQHYDLILDAVGNHTISDYKRALNPGGIAVIVGFSGFLGLIQHMVLGRVRSKFGDKKVTMFVASVVPEDLEFLAKLIDNGKVTPVIDRHYTLDRIPDAVRYVVGPGHKPGHARGKVIIDIDTGGI
ncbi:NAD(P)-dependent alcohol dehydrogenase [Candidatus Bathyarchaeota archaeon]|nr:NAD(P)-dependent alcohol dehydrogenase [Candidatus Bathyarchaeota archaeon]